MLVLLGLPDHEVRERCFRIYNERLAELQEAAPGRFYGVGMINWWDAAGARRTMPQGILDARVCARRRAGPLGAGG